jgi:hypothetical protein
MTSKNARYIRILGEVRSHAQLPIPTWRITRNEALFRVVDDFVQGLVLGRRRDGTFYPAWNVTSLILPLDEGWPGHGDRIRTRDRREIWTLDDDPRELAAAFVASARPQVYERAPSTNAVLEVFRNYWRTWDTPFCEGVALFREGKLGQAVDALRAAKSQIRPEWTGERPLFVARTLDAILDGNGKEFLNEQRLRQLELLRCWVVPDDPAGNPCT